MDNMFISFFSLLIYLFFFCYTVTRWLPT